MFIPKEGGGSRPVTPVNYFVQDALKPTHDYLMEVLRQQPGDCTYDEPSARSFLALHTKRGDDVSCFDWTGATDCDPVDEGSYEVVKALRGRANADA